MIKFGSKAFDEIVLCAIAQDFVKPINILGRLHIDMSDYLKLKDLEY
jgi:hypothetical protein